MAELFYDASFVIAAAAAAAIIWQAFTSDGSPSTDPTPDVTDSYDDEQGWDEGDADDD